MADWIKVEITSSQKIEVLTIADILDIDDHTVFGKLVILWCWADANTVDGHADNVTKRMIDRVVGHSGFADAMLDSRVKWLKDDGKGGVYFANFDRHNGKGAKKRAVDSRRKASHRAAVAESSDNCHDSSVTDTVTREEKRREEKKEKELTSSKEDLCPHQEIIDAYHKALPTMSKVRIWSEKRRSLLRARWREDSNRQNINWWTGFFDYIAKSDFLTGKTERPFSCDLEWIVNSTNFVKIIEGKYHK